MHRRPDAYSQLRVVGERTSCLRYFFAQLACNMLIAAGNILIAFMDRKAQVGIGRADKQHSNKGSTHEC